MSLTTFLEKKFQLKAHNTNVKVEAIAGMTTFLAMSYIIFVNPSILGTTGMDTQAIFVATCLAAAVGSLIMGLFANFPIGLAPGMGLNAFFAFTVVAGMGYTWQQALGAVFISGCVFLLLTVTGVRKWLIEGIPASIRISITTGIGLFLALIAFKNVGIVVDNPATFIALGDVKNHTVLFTLLGFFAICAMDYFKIKGAILISILGITTLSTVMGYNHVDGIFSLPPSLAPTFLALDIMSILNTGIVHVILVLVLVEVFDATGTLMGILNRAGLLTPQNEKRLNRALFADSLAIVAGSGLGTSSTTAYAESAAGVEAGGRTGLTACVVAILFLCALFFSPLAAAVPAYAVAPALIYVACLMQRELTDVNWDDKTQAIPAALTAIMMPFTYSIATGIAAGFISYTVLKVATFRFKDLHPATVIIAVLFAIKYAFFE